MLGRMAAALVVGAMLAACGTGGASQEPIRLPTGSPPGAAGAVVATEIPATEVATEAVVTEAVTEAPTVALPTPTPSPEAQATPVPLPRPNEATIALETRWEGLELPVFVTHAGDGSGRIFIVEKTGAIRIVRDGALLERPFLDIRTRVNSTGNEQGMLGLAFAPDYATSGVFYAHYTDADGNTMIARFVVTGDADLADAASELPVLQLEQPARNHNGGMLAFGPDSYLYIGMGDGGGAGDRFGNGQNPATLLGKMLRLDVSSAAGSYAIPADNPWVNLDWNGTDVRDEIWAVGLRNPWRYSFDRATGDLWIGDVGQNQYEEIDRIPAGPTGYPAGGLNFGWPLLEGTHCYSASNCSSDGLEMPVAEYSHAAGHCSVTGGYVYRGPSFPALYGAYFYGDYCSGVMWAVWPGPEGAPAGGWLNAEVLRSGGTISSFGEDEAGELYVTDMARGTVSQLVVR